MITALTELEASDPRGRGVILRLDPYDRLPAVAMTVRSTGTVIHFDVPPKGARLLEEGVLSLGERRFEVSDPLAASEFLALLDSPPPPLARQRASSAP